MTTRYRKTAACAVVLGILAGFAISPAMSANLIATPGISLDERWDSNIHNSSTDETSDYVFRASPRLTLTVATSQIQVHLKGQLDFERYAEHSELNERASMLYELRTTGPFRVTPRFSVLPSARFVETNDAVSRTELTQEPIPGLPPSETTVTGRTKTREYSGSLHLTYLLTPNVDLGLGGGATKRSFLDDDPGTVDSDSVFGNSSISYRFTPRFSSGIYFDTRRNTFENDADSRSYSLGLSTNYLLAEHITFGARAGASYVKETTATGDDTVTSPSGQVTLDYAWKAFKAGLLGSYDLAGGGSFGATTRRATIQLVLSQQFAQAWWWNLSGYYQINQSFDTPRTQDTSTWYGTAGLRYQAAEWAAFRLAGSLLRQRAHDSIEGDDLDRNSILLGLDLSTGYKLF